jgi:alpha-tubulin suppressor-like RCC1 family protein
MFSARQGFYFGASARSFGPTLISSINSMSAAIKPNGTLWTWGTGNRGNLGLNDTLDRSLPVQLGTSNWSQIAINPVNINTVYAIKANGTLWAWGDGSNGSNATNSTVNRSSPVQIGSSGDWSSLSLGGAINNSNNLYVWGFNSSGQLGLGDRVNRSSPTQLAGSWMKAIILTNTSVGIKGDGTLWTWGSNLSGNLGDNTTVNKSSPVNIITSQKFNQVAQTEASGAAISDDSSLWVWGYNQFGTLPTGNTINRSSPVQIAGTWSSISLSTRRGYGIQADGSMWGWGINDGMLGVNPTQSWSQLSSTNDHTLAIRDDGSLWAWGSNFYGQLGTDNQLDNSIPAQIGTNSWTSVSAGLTSSYAIRNDGSLWVWGRNNSSQLGDSTTVNKSSPIQLGANSWSQVSASKQSNFVLAIRSDNTVYGWGDNSYGSTGAGNVGAIINSPTQISGGGSFVSVSAGGGHAQAIDVNNKLYGWGLNNTVQTGSVGTGFSWTFITASEPITNTGGGVYAIRNDGSLWVWGNGVNGQLGLGDTISRSSPVQLGTDSWVSVSSGGQFAAFAIRKDGALFAWGFNSSGRLGLVDRIDRSSPVQIGTSSWSQVAAGQSHTFALKPTGELFSWGGNINGVLGSWTPTATSGFRSSPVQVGTRLYSKIASGAFHGLAIDTTSKLWVWGQNSTGQLGLNLGVGAHRSQPIQLGTSNWTQVAAPNTGVSLGITSLGQLFAWGANGTGVLGRNDVIFRSSPIQIGSSSWTQVSTTGRGQVAVYGITITGRLYAWGTNSAGQLATNDTINRSSPVQIMTDTTDWIYTGGGYGIRSTSGILWGWGFGSDGQIGDSTTISRSSPVQIGFNAENPLYSPILVGNSSWTSVSAGGSHSVAISSNGLLYAWGLNSSGQLGLNDITTRASPTQVGTSSWNQVSAGSSFVLGRTINNSIMAWGHNANGQLALMTSSASRSNPVQIPFFSSPNLTSSNVMVIAGADTGFHINKIGSLWGWGDNSNGQLGTSGDISSTNTIPIHVDPVAILTSPIQVGVGNSWTQVSAVTTEIGVVTSKPALTGAIAQTDQNEIYIWGINSGLAAGDADGYRIGNGTESGAEPVPVIVTL